MRPNDDIRAYAKQNKVLLWQIADALSIADTTFSKELRREVSPERREEIYEAIRKIAAAGRT